MKTLKSFLAPRLGVGMSGVCILSCVHASAYALVAVLYSGVMDGRDYYWYKVRRTSICSLNHDFRTT